MPLTRTFLRRLSAPGLRGALAAVALLCGGPGAAAQQPSPPQSCQGDPNFEQFNFLLGAWDVFRGDAKSAEVHWTRDYAGCAFIEIWSAAVPGRQSGIGLVTYSRLRGSPTYYYVGDQGGNTVSVRAETRPNDVIFIIEQPSASGVGTRTRRFQLALQADGSILENSTASENGGPYQPEFQLIWRKRS